MMYKKSPLFFYGKSMQCCKIFCEKSNNFHVFRVRQVFFRSEMIPSDILACQYFIGNYGLAISAHNPPPPPNVVELWECHVR